MKIRSFSHKGLRQLRQLYEEDSRRGIPQKSVDKLRKMLAYLDEMASPSELQTLPHWGAHTLSGDRKGTWSLIVTRNLRLTFRIDAAESEIYDMDLEDYH